MSDSQTQPKKTLQIQQTWFLGVTALAVVLMFAFVILPYVDPNKGARLVQGVEAQDFNLELMTGGGAGDRVKLSDLRGKVVVLDFWASWCHPCQEQASVLKGVLPKLGNDVYVLGVATSDERSEAEAFAKKEGLPYPTVYDDDGKLGAAYRVQELPTMVFIDPQGTIQGRFNRILTSKEISDLAKQLGAK